MKRQKAKKHSSVYYRKLLCALMFVVGVFVAVPDANSVTITTTGSAGFSSGASAGSSQFGGRCSININGSINCNSNNPYVNLIKSSAGIRGFEDYCPRNLSMGDSQGFYFISRIVPCVRGHLQAAGEKFVTGLYIFIEPIIKAGLILAVALFGILILSQGFIEKLSRDSFVFVLKIAAVLWATQNLTGLTELMLMIMDGLLDAVNSKIGLSGFGSINVINNYKNFNASSLHCALTDHMWVRLDCMINIIIGINSTGSLANGMLAFFFSSFISGTMGMLIGGIGLYFSVNILLGILNAAYIYIMATTTIIILFMIGGIIIPLIFFKNTFEYYRKWLNILMATILQPVLVFAFLNVAMVAFDVIIYSGDDSIMRTIAGNDAKKSDFNLNDYLDDNDLLKKDGIGFELDFKEVVFQTADKFKHDGMDANFISNPVNLATKDRGRDKYDGADKDPSDTRVHFPYKAIDWEEIAKLRKKTKTELLKSVAASFIMAGLAAFILISFLKYIPSLAVGLAGGSFQAPVLSGHNGASQSLRANTSRVVDNIGSKATNLVTGRR